ncbi:MAG: GGDEF domain-containing protein [Candidatus Omnitrophica bacterium]|nr:GGDEF domain-containing protein [Candidatus Omnitrophota bacterium]
MILEHTHKDALTGFYRREALVPFLEEALAKAQSNQKSASLVIIDLDHFKKFNDRYGHQFGDEVLKHLSNVLRYTIQEKGAIFRYGGDEFVIVLPALTGKEAFKLSLRCMYNIDHSPFIYQGKMFKLCMSCGISSYPADGTSVDILFRRADEALYYSKRHGRGIATSAGKMKHLRVLSFLKVVFGLLFVIGALYGIYRFIPQEIITEFAARFKNISIKVEEKDAATIVLKSGRIIKGNIIQELGDRIIVKLDLGKGEGRVTIKKSDIAKIEY